MNTQIDCPKCEGHGKLASHNQKSWKQFEGLSYGSEEMKGVREGTITPVVCPDCLGTKKITKPATEDAKPAV